MSAFAPRVELGFGSTWQTEPASITWTEVTGRVMDRRQDISIERGATAAFGDIDPGSLQLLLRNHDRAFDPAHAASPYVGNLVPGVPVRVSTVIDPDGSATVRRLFTGFVNGWPQSWSHDDQFTVVPITAWDGLAKLDRTPMPASAWVRYITEVFDGAASDAAIIAPLDDADTGTIRNYGTLGPGEWTPEAERNTDLIPIGPGHDAVSVDGDAYGMFKFSRSDPCASILVDLSDAELTDAQIIPILEAWTSPNLGIGLFPASHWTLAINVTNAAQRLGKVLFYRGTGTANGRAADEAITLDRPYLVGFSFSAGGGTAFDHLFIDGVEVPWSSQSLDGLQTSDGDVTRIGNSKRFGAGAGRLGCFVSWPRFSVEADNETVHAAVFPALTAYDGDRTGERIDRVLDWSDWPTNARSTTNGRTLLGPAQFTSDDTVLAYARLCAATENGRLFVAADGTLTFHDRWHLEVDETTASVTIAGDGPDDPFYRDLDRSIDDELLVTTARVTRRGGKEQIAQADDLTSPGDLSVTTIHVSDVEAATLAEHLVNTRSAPVERVPMVRVPMHALSPADAAAVAALDLGNRVEITSTVGGVGDPITVQSVVDGIRDEIGVAEWWRELILAPAPTRSVFLIGSSLLGGDDVLTY